MICTAEKKYCQLEYDCERRKLVYWRCLVSVGSAGLSSSHGLPCSPAVTNLLPVDAPLTPGKIHESNSLYPGCSGRNGRCGTHPAGRCSGCREQISAPGWKQAVKAKADVIVSTAGVSVGAFDFVKSVIEEDGELDFWKVNMRPGKPLAFGKYRGIPFFGLPGNPVSAFVGFEVFVRPALEKLSGQEIRPHLQQTAYLAESLESDGREILPASHC